MAVSALAADLAADLTRALSPVSLAAFPSRSRTPRGWR